MKTHTDDKLFVGTLTKDVKTEIKQDECFVTLDIQGTKVRFTVDTGSQANIMSTSKVKQLKSRPYIEKIHTRLISYTSTDLLVRGHAVHFAMTKQQLRISHSGDTTRTYFKFPSLIGSGYSKNCSKCGKLSNKLQDKVCQSV